MQEHIGKATEERQAECQSEATIAVHMQRQRHTETYHNDAQNRIRQLAMEFNQVEGIRYPLLLQGVGVCQGLT